MAIADRPHHSTETAVLQVLSDILLAVDREDLAALVLLDLSAAFDTVDHAILSRRLNYIWHQWCRSSMVQVLLVRPYSVCPPWTHKVCGRQSTVRRSTRIYTGAGAVCSLHCRPHRTDRMSQPVTTSVR